MMKKKAIDIAQHEYVEPIAISSLASAKSFIQKWLTAAQFVISELSPQDAVQITRAVNESVALFTTARVAENGSAIALATSMLGEKGELQRIILNSIARHMWGEFPTPEQITTLSLSLRRQFITALERDLWLPIAESHETNLTSAKGIYSSNTVPLNVEFGKKFNAAEFAKYEGRGTPSAALKVPKWERDAPTPILANGWITILKNPFGEDILSAFRSASLVHYGILDPHTRRAKINEAASELLKAIVAKNIHDGIDLKSTPIKIATFQLQTRAEELDNNSEMFPEKNLIDEQYRALQELKGRRTINLDRKTISFSVELLYFNYPIHHIGFRENLGFLGEVAVRNGAATRSILTEAENALKEEGFSSNRGKKIAMLLEELAKIQESSPAAITHDPYRFNSRFINLAHLLGYTVHLNCRSGKDRTGIVDAEAKYVAEALDGAVRSGDPSVAPDFQRAPSPLEQATIFHYAMESGSVAIQRHCTGVPGSLLQPILSEKVTGDPLVNRIGEKNWIYFRGLSKFARA